MITRLLAWRCCCARPRWRRLAGAPRHRWRSRSTTRSRWAGPITKIIDGYAADFKKENPGIKVKPVYAGTYQETIVKALTALQERRAAARPRSCSRPTCSR